MSKTNEMLSETWCVDWSQKSLLFVDHLGQMSRKVTGLQKICVYQINFSCFYLGDM